MGQTDPPAKVASNAQLGLEPGRDALAEQLACVRQALPEHLRDSVPSVVVATLVADNALLKAPEQRLLKLLEGADRRAVAHGKELIELAARAANVAGERAANALLTAELEQRRRPLTEYEVDRLWLQRVDLHDGALMPQLRDFARAIQRAIGIVA